MTRSVIVLLVVAMVGGALAQLLLDPTWLGLVAAAAWGAVWGLIVIGATSEGRQQ